MPTFDEKEIFNRARRIEARDERSLYLKEACEDDDQLLTRVEALLRIDAQEPGFLVSPAVPPIAADVATEGPGTQIGPYKLIEQIGEGGFGVVFLAERKEPIRRLVALK
ncbi:MAG: serine/threonine protein kinase, partial [Pirellulales bacterium]